MGLPNRDEIEGKFDQAKGKTGNAQNRRFQRARDRSGIGRVVAQIRSVIDARSADVRLFFRR